MANTKVCCCICGRTVSTEETFRVKIEDSNNRACVKHEGVVAEMESVAAKLEK